MKAGIIIATNRMAIRNFIAIDMNIPNTSRIIYAITAREDMEKVRGLPFDNTPWYALPFQRWTPELRECYTALELRFGPVWEEKAFIDRMQELALEIR